MKNESNEKMTGREKNRIPSDIVKLERVDEDPDRHLIRLLLSKPPNERTHFLRVPLPQGGSGI